MRRCASLLFSIKNMDTIERGKGDDAFAEHDIQTPTGVCHEENVPYQLYRLRMRRQLPSLHKEISREKKKAAE